jgi:hypothetical protein
MPSVLLNQAKNLPSPTEKTGSTQEDHKLNNMNMKHIHTFEGFSNHETINEGQESLKMLLSNESSEIQKLAAEVEKMLEPVRFKIGIAYYDDVMKKIAEMVKAK